MTDPQSPENLETPETPETDWESTPNYTVPHGPSTKRTVVVVLATLLTLAGVWGVAGMPHENVAMALSPNRQQLAGAPKPGDTVMTQMDPYTFLDPIPVGQPAPDFSVTDANGAPLKLSGFKGKQNVVLIFYQGDFCPVCGKQLDNYQSNLKKFKDAQTEIIAISSDDTDHAAKTLGEHGLGFKVVGDKKLSIIKKFGVLNVKKKTVAWPAVFVVDKAGVVRLSHADAKFTRLYSEDILPVLQQINSGK